MGFRGRHTSVGSASPSAMHHKRKLISSAFLVTVVVVLFYQSSRIRVFHPFATSDKKGHSRDGSLESFVEEAQEAVMDAFDPTSLQRYCSNVLWEEKSAMDCGQIRGDIGKEIHISSRSY